jgi:hypothetical protein
MKAWYKLTSLYINFSPIPPFYYSRSFIIHSNHVLLDDLSLAFLCISFFKMYYRNTIFETEKKNFEKKKTFGEIKKKRL